MQFTDKQKNIGGIALTFLVILLFGWLIFNAQQSVKQDALDKQTTAIPIIERSTTLVGDFVVSYNINGYEAKENASVVMIAAHKGGSQWVLFRNYDDILVYIPLENINAIAQAERESSTGF